LRNDCIGGGTEPLSESRWRATKADLIATINSYQFKEDSAPMVIMLSGTGGKGQCIGIGSHNDMVGAVSSALGIPVLEEVVNEALERRRGIE
jgi:hypothetical protein